MGGTTVRVWDCVRRKLFLGLMMLRLVDERPAVEAVAEDCESRSRLWKTDAMRRIFAL